MIDQPGRCGRSSPLDGLTERVIDTAPLNTEAMVRALRELAPDVLALAATGIVTEAIVQIPTVGTLNSHPGLLPWVRGNGAVDHAIRLGIPVGISVHWVDKGIDTGNVLHRRLVPATPVDTLGSLRAKADELRWFIFAEVLSQVAAGNPTVDVHQAARFPLCRWP